MTKVLLIEDNPHNVHLFTTALEFSGFEVTHAGDGEQGLALAIELCPDLVLLDLSLPKLDGWAVAKAIRAHENPEVQGLTVVALTAHAMKGDRDRALEVGCDDYISKPVSPLELSRKIETILKDRAA